VRKKTIDETLVRWRRAFAAVLAASRRDADLTQQQVADEMGWHRNTVTKIESGLRPVTAEELIVLVRLYKIGPEALLARVLRW
jgi:transcriptional regulator with XRE-family HTH domain